MLEMINFVFPISAFMVSSSRLGSDNVSGDDGCLDFDESFDSCITATLTLFLSNTAPTSVSLLPIPLALNCRTSCHH